MEAMHIRIETASEQLLQSQYPELIEGLRANGETFRLSKNPVAPKKIIVCRDSRM